MYILYDRKSEPQFITHTYCLPVCPLLDLEHSREDITQKNLQYDR